jgi:hypothetical protein
MSDDEAYMRLVTDNAQGELSPLEIGIHALGSVELSEGGAGKKGGLREYARLVGKTDVYIGQLRNAASVYKSANLSLHFQDKAKHLSEISRADETTWPQLCEALQNGVLTTVDDVGKAVARVKGIEAARSMRRSLRLARFNGIWLGNGTPKSGRGAGVADAAQGQQAQDSRPRLHRSSVAVLVALHQTAKSLAL